VPPIGKIQGLIRRMERRDVVSEHSSSRGVGYEVCGMFVERSRRDGEMRKVKV
jgi:hypothetical protein